MSEEDKLANLAVEIEKLVRQYSALAHAGNRPPGKEPAAFIPGETVVPYAGRVFDENEVAAAVRASLDFWLTLGPEGAAFQQELASTLGVKHTVLVNSGSSANLRRIFRADEPETPQNEAHPPRGRSHHLRGGFSDHRGAHRPEWSRPRFHRQRPRHRQRAR